MEVGRSIISSKNEDLWISGKALSNITVASFPLGQKLGLSSKQPLEHTVLTALARNVMLSVFLGVPRF